MPIFNTVYGGGWTPASKYKYLTYTLDQTQSSPGSMITAISEDAQNMFSSDVINLIWAYPVLLDNSGNEYRKLNPNNFQQFEDWTDASSYTASANYDVMIAFPRRWYKISTTNNITTFSLTNNPNDAEYTYLPWQRLTSGALWSNAVFQDKDVFYLWAYKWYVDSSKLRSWYNKTPTVNTYIYDFNAQTINNKWNRWWITEFVQETYLELCFMAIYKTTNAQTAIWRWYVDASGSNYPGPASWVNTYNKGMIYGTTSWTEPMKFLWLEHWYGWIWEWVNWWTQDSNGVHISIPDTTSSNRSTTSSYNYAPSGNTNVGSISLTNWAYITKVMWSQYGWFTPTNNSWGSDSTYFTGYARRSSGSRVAVFGGGWSSASRCGAFCWSLDTAASSRSAYIGARLMFL